MKKVTDFVINFLNYLKKNLMEDNPQFTIPSKVEQCKLFSTNQFVVHRLQINEQYDGWSCGFHSLLARQNFYNFYWRDGNSTKNGSETTRGQ